MNQYQAAANELQKSAVRASRSQAIRKALNNSYVVSNWTGTLESLQTTGDGKAWIVIRIPDSSMTIETMNNGISDIGHDTLISQSNPLYSTLATMKTGQQVTFSGSFLPGNPDIILERSITESGSMTKPAFIFHFSMVK